MHSEGAVRLKLPRGVLWCCQANRKKSPFGAAGPFWYAPPMRPISFKHHRFPPDTIRLAVWLYYRFTTSLRDVEEMLAERGIDVSYETIRCWANKFGRPSPPTSAAPDRVPTASGTSTKWSSASEINGCSCGALSTAKARSSTCSSRNAGTRQLH